MSTGQYMHIRQLECTTLIHLHTYAYMCACFFIDSSLFSTNLSAKDLLYCIWIFQHRLHVDAYGEFQLLNVLLRMVPNIFSKLKILH